MKSVLPHPLLSFSLFVMWVLLNGPAGPATFLLALAIAIVVPWSLSALEPPPARVRNVTAMLRLVGVVLVDIVRSNAAVATIILAGRRRDRVSGFVHIPLDIRSPYALATLAIIITSTPGTLWVQHDSATGRLLLHVLDLVDERIWIDLIKNRYESLLKEIFE